MRLSQDYMRVYGDIIQERDLSKTPPIEIGHVIAGSTVLPSPESTLDGEIKFIGGYGWSNDWIINWVNGASATWELLGQQESFYEVSIQHNSKIISDDPAIFALSAKGMKPTTFSISDSHWSDYFPSPDRVVRGEVYEKQWKDQNVGPIRLPHNQFDLKLSAVHINPLDTIEIKSVTIEILADD